MNTTTQRQSDTMSPPDWVRDAIFYQIFPDRFARSARLPKPDSLEDWDARPTFRGYKGGDLYGIIEHLDHIETLGANALYLTPIFQAASNHRYNTHDYYQVDPMLGGTQALRELLDTCHARGMRVILDGVFNHAGRGFFPFHDLLESGASSTSSLPETTSQRARVRSSVERKPSGGWPSNWRRDWRRKIRRVGRTKSEIKQPDRDFSGRLLNFP